MKRLIVVVALMLVLLVPAAALAEIGFAEVRMDRVNLRKSIGGDLITRMERGKSVFVFEEEVRNGQLWCHVTTNVGRDCREAWVRGDMLRFASEELTGAVSIMASDSYVVCLRADGTVGIIGNDMPHSACVETVRAWTGIRDVVPGLCEVFGLDEQGVLHGVGRSWALLDGAQDPQHPFTSITGSRDRLIPLSNGYYYLDSWVRDMGCADMLKGVEISKVCWTSAGYIVLTHDGALRYSNEVRGHEKMEETYQSGPYVDFATYDNISIALCADGHAQALPSTLDVSGWDHVVQVAANREGVLGLRDDGTVLYAGTDELCRKYTAAWTDIKEIAMCGGYCVGLKTDGAVVMAGKYLTYDR